MVYNSVSDKVLLFRYTKVKGIGIKQILRRIWLISENKINLMNAFVNNQVKSNSNSTHHCDI